MKILITGGAGFIASHIVDAYIADGHDVAIIDNLSTGRMENVNPKARLYEIDICDSAVAQVFEKERPEILNHHAAQIDVRSSLSDPLNDLRVNVGGFINLIEAGRKVGIKKVILASSGGAIYGEQEIFPATENHPTRPISPYGLNKLACEQYLNYYEKQFGLGWVALRYANVYGPRQSPKGEAGVVAVFLKKMLTGEQPIINGDGGQTRDYVYVEDVVKANCLALNCNMAGSYNIGTGIETDVNSIFRIIRELTGSKCEEIHIPQKAGETRRSCLTSERIARESGWKPRAAIAEGMEITTERFKISKVGITRLEANNA